MRVAPTQYSSIAIASDLASCARVVRLAARRCSLAGFGSFAVFHGAPASIKIKRLPRLGVRVSPVVVFSVALVNVKPNANKLKSTKIANF